MYRKLEPDEIRQDGHGPRLGLDGGRARGWGDGFGEREAGEAEVVSSRTTWLGSCAYIREESIYGDMRERRKDSQRTARCSGLAREESVNWRLWPNFEH